MNQHHEDTAAELAGFPVVVRWPVQWGDQDAFGHVNNTVYFRWFETCRIEYLHRMGLDEALLARQQIGPILAAISCQYRRPVTFPDTVQIAARITRLGRSSVGMEHRLYSEAMQVVAADGDSTIVVYDYGRGASTPIPDAMRKAIEQIEGRTFGDAKS
ncbi:MAG TPA: thioesterase family protein [Pirellulales bacterium]|jgi:acyl-CoA thioester hydrolase|nr:thioesterase family protein [Pirellulales bacterium]